MKNFKYILFLSVFGFIIGCSSDSTDDTVAEIPDVDVPIDKSANLLGSGDSAFDFLSNNNFTSVRIEIAFNPGFRPSQNTLDLYQEYIRLHTFKEDIELVFTEIPSAESENEEFSLQEIVDIETENRTVFNDGDTLGVYIYFANAPSDNDDEDEGLVTLGAVYRNTSMVVYDSTIRRLTAGNTVVTTSILQIATLNHEFGHLFGLVNLGTIAINDHEDIEAANHCNVPGCLMQAQLEFGGGMMDMLENNNGIIPILDPECRLDLNSNGGRDNTDTAS